MKKKIEEKKVVLSEKKRALILVDREAWEGSQRLLKEMRISNQLFNEMLNYSIRSQYKLLQGLKKKQDAGEKVTLGDFLKMMGGILNEIDSDQLQL